MNITKTKRKVTAGVAALAAIALFAGGALAHTSIAESDPADGSTVDAPPAEVSVRFGSPELPAQPGAITEGRLEVLDACGARVDNDDSEADMTTSTVTATSGGAAAGRYEIHWFVTAADGESQAGALDFVVANGEPCSIVRRADAADDVDLGLDPVAVTAKRTGAAGIVTIKTAEPFKCSDLSATKDDALSLSFDQDYDETNDLTGTFVCRRGKLKLQVAGPDAKEGEFDFSVAASMPSAKKVVVRLPDARFGTAEASLDLYVEASSESDDCEDDGKVCLDRAPDLGALRVP